MNEEKQIATLPPASAAGEREQALAWAKQAGLISWVSDDGLYFHFAESEEMSSKLVAFAALATKPQAS